MKLANFPGCSATSTGLAYTESFNYVAGRVGIELVDIPDWNCCGASAGHLQSHDLGDALPARSLALAEEAHGDTPVLALCAGCYQNLRRALVHGRSSEERLAQINELLQRDWKAQADVLNGIEPFLDEEVAARAKEQVVEPLNGLKVACYYGCALVRPRALSDFDDEEQPHSMEQVVAITGAAPIEWHFKTECCGASHQVSAASAAKPLIERIFDNAAANGAEAIATACPLCMLNLDMREAEVNKARLRAGKKPYDIPVYYFTELLAASFGAPAEEIGIERHFHPAAAALAAAKAREPEPEPLTPEQEKEERKRKALELAAKKKAEKAAAAAAAAGEGPEDAGRPDGGAGNGAVAASESVERMAAPEAAVPAAGERDAAPGAADGKEVGA